MKEFVVDDHERQRQLEALEEQVRTCQRCSLGMTRQHAVPGEGPVNATIMLIGEGPGANEDQTGRPFVGAAGQLLEELLASIGLTREDVYIANVVKCRPPNNRNPSSEEINACKGYLAQQLRIIKPEVILTLGRFAMERWLPNNKISEIHGQGFHDGRRLIVPMFHPAAALHQPARRQTIFDDFLELPSLIDEARAMQLIGAQKQDSMIKS